MVRRWQDDLHDALVAHFGEERGNQLYHRFGNAFPAGYREDCSVAEAVTDAAIMDTLGAEKKLAMNLYAGRERSATPLRLRVFHLSEPIPLSLSLPMLEHMGVKVLEELNYKVEPERNAADLRARFRHESRRRHQVRHYAGEKRV